MAFLGSLLGTLSTAGQIAGAVGTASNLLTPPPIPSQGGGGGGRSQIIPRREVKQIGQRMF